MSSLSINLYFKDNFFSYRGQANRQIADDLLKVINEIWEKHNSSQRFPFTFIETSLPPITSFLEAKGVSLKKGEGYEVQYTKVKRHVYKVAFNPYNFFQLTGVREVDSSTLWQRRLSPEIRSELDVRYTELKSNRLYWHYLAKNWIKQNYSRKYTQILKRYLNKLNRKAGGNSLNHMDNGWSPLHVSVLVRNDAAIHFFMRNGASSMLKDQTGATPRDYALQFSPNLMPRFDSDKYIQILNILSTKSDLVSQNETIPLHEAAGWGELDCLLRCLDKGADINTQDSKGATPLHVAAAFGHHRVVKTFIQKGAKLSIKTHDGKTPLDLAAEAKQKKCVLALLDAAMLPEFKADGFTPLHYAARIGHLPAVKAIYSRNLLNASRDHKQVTPQHQVAAFGQIEVLEFLLEKGADLEAQDELGGTPFHYAASKGDCKTIDFLCRRGANSNARTYSGQTALHATASTGNIAVMRMLLRIQKGGALEDQDQKGRTPLHWAAMMGRAQAIHVLCAAGANRRARAERGITPLHSAALEGQAVAIEALLANEGIKEIDVIDEIGATPLHYAVVKNHLSAVKMLLDKKANPNIQSNKIKPPLMIAKENGFHEIAELLQKKIDGL